MKNDKDWIKDLLGVNQYLEHFKKHRRQGRIFFRGIVCAIKIGMATFGITLATFGITFGLAFALYGGNILLDILNVCF
jgi:hypothetical protein